MSMGMWVNGGPLPWVLFYIPLMWNVCAMRWKYRQYRRYHVIFARKYETLQKINILGARFNSSSTPLFETKQLITIWYCHSYV